VVQFEHGHNANGDRLVIMLTRATIANQLLADGGHKITGLEHELLKQLFDAGTVKLG